MRLGEIVGEVTAGANGNLDHIPLPGGFAVTFTGIKVLKDDGSQHHLVGIQPTIPIKPTVAGVWEGGDVVLEAAIEAVRPLLR